VLKAGTQCSVCWASPSTSPAAGTAGTGSTGASTQGNCCAKSTCYQGQTTSSCATIDAAAKFIGSQQCSVCFAPAPATVSATCTQQSINFCKLACNNQLISCTCSANSISPVCTASPSPTGSGNPPSTPQPVPHTQPPGTPFTYTVQSGPPVTGVYVPETQPNGQPVTDANGIPLTNAIIPVTDSSGNVPDPGNTLVIVPVTDNNGNVVGTDTATTTLTPAPTAPSGTPKPSGCAVQPSWCKMVCGDSGVASCTCSGVQCNQPIPTNTVTNGGSSLAALLSAMVVMMVAAVQMM